MRQGEAMMHRALTAEQYTQIPKGHLHSYEMVYTGVMHISLATTSVLILLMHI